MDKSETNNEINHDREQPIDLQQIKYLKKIVEQDHRAIKRVTKPMLSFKSFRSARKVLAGIELMHMIRKGQMIVAEGNKLAFAEQFYTLTR
jgi:putative transposase